MPAERRCEKCGAALASFGAEALCPNCMLREAIRLGADITAQPAASLGKAGTAVVAPVTEKAGDKIGRYKLLQQIGEGGMGVVYMAEQEEPVRRRVALKVIKLGMDTKSVIARFEAERQALALMDHPNIAKIFDAGITGAPVAAGVSPAVEPGVPPGGTDVDIYKRLESSVTGSGGKMPPSTAGETPAATLSAGRPYFVMELVRGIRITDYCNENQLSTPQRLDLFTLTCSAIQHAHQKGIIHRDIKPSNILVTLHDGVPMPKIIDFGIAKATSDQRLTDKTLFTAFQQFVGTPAYMSPEQAELSGLDIDTRSDIYSLGVLLYELLTGQTPFEAKELLAAGLDAMRRTIREKEPPKPSTRLTMELVAAKGVGRVTPCASSSGESTSTGGAHGVTRPTSKSEIDEASARRLLQVKELIHLVRGDLDWIVMKALEKDRARRYESANGLAMDIQRHLANEPVVARPPSATYRFQKLVRRNKIAVAAVSAVAVALVIGLGVSTIMFIKERADLRRAVEAEHKAIAQTVKSEQVAQFLKDMLNGVGPSVALGRDTIMLREILDKTAEHVGKDLKNQPDTEAELRNLIGEVSLALAQYESAEAVHRSALAIRITLFGNEHAAVAESLHNLAKTLLVQGKLAEAETMQRQALVMRRRLFGKEHPEVATSLSNLGSVLFKQGRRTEAEAAYREALAMRHNLFGNEHPSVASSLNNLADVLLAQGKLPEAATTYRGALARLRKLLGNEHPDLIETLNSLAKSLSEQDRAGQPGKLAEAESLHREALTMSRKLLGNSHPFADQSLDSLAEVLQTQGKLSETESLYREDLAMAVNRLGGEDPGLAIKLSRLGSELRAQGKFTDAQALEQEALIIAHKLAKTDPPGSEDIIARMAGVFRHWKQYAAAEPLYREALMSARKFATNNSARLEDRITALADCLRDQNKSGEAEALYREALASARTFATNDLPRLELRMNEMADLLQYEGKLAEAETLYRETLMLKKKRVGNEARDVGLLLRSLAYLFQREGKLAEAESAYLEAAAMAKKIVGNDRPEDSAWPLYGLAWVLQMQGKLTEAETAARQSLAMRRKMKLPTADELVVADSLYQLAVVLWSEGKADEAEQPARECLALFESKAPSGWQTFNSRSTLAGILAAENQYVEAEPLLLSAYEGLEQPEGKFPAAVKPRLKETLQRLVQLYEATGRPDKAAEWKQKLEAFGQPVPATKSAVEIKK